MSEAAELEQEQATDPLDETINTLAGILARLRVAREEGGNPGELDARGAAVAALGDELMRLPVRLLREARECRGEAKAMRAAEAAAGALEDAATALADDEAAYTETAAPELSAARRAVTARQLAEAAADALKLAEESGAEPAELAQLHGRARDSATVLESETRKLSEAQAARQAAKAKLDKTRQLHRDAGEALTAAQDAAAEPTTADLDPAELAWALRFSWPARLASALNGREPKLSRDEYTAIRFLACETCDENGWIPDGAESRVRTKVGQEMLTEVRAGRGVTLVTAQGPVTLQRVGPGQAVVGGGANQLATAAMSH